MVFKNLRKFTKVIMWGIAIFIVPAFVIWNVGSAVRNRRSGYAGEIFQRKVAWKDFTREKQAARNDLLLRYGDQMQASGPELDEQAWTRLILREEARRRNITVTNEELIRHIKDLPLFRFEKMDPRTYTEIIGHVFQQSPADFEDGMRTSLMNGKLLQEVSAAVTVSDEEIGRAYRDDREKAAVDFMVVSAEEFRDQVPLDNESALRDYFNERTEEFKMTEQVDVEYLSIKLESFKDAVMITDAQVQEYYERHREQYRLDALPPPEDSPPDAAAREDAYAPLEQVGDAIRDILREQEMNERAALQARDIMNRLYSDQDLARAGDAFGLTVQRTGPFSLVQEIPQVGLSFAFAQAAFSLNPGEISEVIKTPTALYILRPVEKIKPFVPPYEEARDAVIHAYRAEQADLLAREHAAALSTEMNTLVAEAGLSFVDAAASMDREARSLEDVTRTGYITGVGYAEEFTHAAFSLNPGEVSDAVRVPRGYAILAARHIIPIDEQDFLAQRERYRQQVLTQRRTTYLTDWFNALKNRATPISYIEEDTR